MDDAGPPALKDRRVSLLVFGILEVLIGALCFLLIPLVLVGMAFSRNNPNGFKPPHIASTIMTYAAMGVCFIVLGVGSALCRRWARALWVCVSGAWLVSGLCALGFVFFLFSNIERLIPSPQAVSVQVLWTIRVVAFAVMFVFYVLIPGILFLFYRGDTVRATCEARDPVTRWTDRCPLPVLSVSIFTALAAAMALMIAVTYAVYPLFGVVLFGLPARLTLVFFAGVMAYIARGVYRLDLSVWRLGLALFVVYGLSNAVTFIWGDFSDIFLRMGLDPRAADLAARLGTSPAFKAMGLLVWVPFLAWYLYVGKFFPSPARAAEPFQSPSQTPL